MRQNAEMLLQFVFECAIIVFVVVSQKAPALPLPFRGGLSLYAKEAVP
jgi:hypothetical protein